MIESPPTVTLTAARASVAEGANTTVTARLSAAASVPVVVNLGFFGTAVLGTDYRTLASRIVIPAGALTASLSILGVQDTLDEANETVFVEIVSVTNGVESGVQRARTTILDDDAPPTVTLAQTVSTIAEAAGTTVIRATLSALSGKSVSVALAFAGTGTLTTDYTRSASQIIIPAGVLSRTITVSTVQDTVSEGNETIIVDIQSVVNGTESGIQRVTTTIVDDEPGGEGESAAFDAVAAYVQHENRLAANSPVTEADLHAIVQYINAQQVLAGPWQATEPKRPYSQVPDFNNDGYVTALDALLVANVIYGQQSRTSFVAEGELNTRLASHDLAVEELMESLELTELGIVALRTTKTAEIHRK